MFEKVLIANRGEIACRIIRTCHRLNIKTVAIYSTIDQNALHVRLADEAYLVGEAPPQDSYLNIDRILRVARDSGAQAIHPGYGFLSENATFAHRCQDAGIKFIGPNPDVMEKMGDKLLARKLAKKAGLPVLPGTGKAVDDQEAEEEAWKLGFPLIVKAAEGGGGIGIHTVDSMEALLPIIERTRQVASSAFGSPRLYFERYLKGASHIEVQIIGDAHGGLVHLFDRDCSVQRRNQKVIEETPAIKLDPQLRQKLCNYALKLGRRIGYTNAGTVEFLVSSDQQIYFLELNARLQVEHGATELITGIDLVELQLRVACGEPLPLTQDNIAVTGHAVEARVYPEDPETLLPQAGTITEIHEPTGAGTRVDSALFNGYEVAVDYEPLLAKVMAWGETREKAINELHKALLAYRIEGVKCNIPLLRDILAGRDFLTGSYDTGSLPVWIEQRRTGHSNGVHKGVMSSNGHDKSGRELAAVLGVSIALSLKNTRSPGQPSQPSSAWRTHGRREQILSRISESRGWR